MRLAALEKEERGRVGRRQRRAESGVLWLWSAEGVCGSKETRMDKDSWFMRMEGLFLFFSFLRKGWKGLGGVWIRWARLF
jgi:hypothetical protein